MSSLFVISCCVFLCAVSGQYASYYSGQGYHAQGGHPHYASGYAQQSHDAGYQQQQPHQGYHQPQQHQAYQQQPHQGYQQQHHQPQQQHHQPHQQQHQPHGAFNIDAFVNSIIHENTGGHSHDDKILSRHTGQSVSGGAAQYRKFRSVSGCERACAATPTCFAGDYNSWSRQCYFHGATTACNTMRVDKSTTHFKKLACTAPMATANAVVSAGMSLSGGIEIPGVKSLLACIKQCEKTGQGLGVTCFGLDWDMSAKRCYLHTTQATSCTNPALRTDSDVTHYAYCP